MQNRSINHSLNKRKSYRISLFLLLSLGVFQGYSQSISGFILDDQNQPVPFVNIYVRELSSGTSSDANGKYFLNIAPGSYQMAVTAVGYETKQLNIVIHDSPVKKNIYLRTSDIALNEIVVKAKRKDPAVEIIQNVIKNREKYLSQIASFKSEIYIKATEIIDEKERKRRVAKAAIRIESQEDSGDVFEKEKLERENEFNKISLMEVQLTLNFQAPNNYKEERTGYKVYGNKSGLFIPTFGQSDFNFYKNLVRMPEITEVPIISPISRTAILTYKYKLVETTVENERLVYKISITPRKSGSSSVKGFIYVNDELWNINKLEVSLDKGGLKFYDKFKINLGYEEIDDTWIQQRLEFAYETKQGRFKNFKGNTVFNYKSFEKNYQFPDKFFDNEISVTTQEAYKRDSTYWNSSRPEPLSTKELAFVHYKDSIERVVKSKDYQDSIQAIYNKISFTELFFDGPGFRNNEKKSHIYLFPIFGLITFEVIGGVRLTPSANYYRRFENGKSIGIWGDLSYGLQNRDMQGNVNVGHLYDPYHFGRINVAVGRSFYSINSFDAFLNQLRASNYILHDRLGVVHSRELFNGFYLSNSININDRKSLEGFQTNTVINRIGIAEDSEVLTFEDYRAIITETRISYTPQQRYISEPNRKIIVGSNYPTISLTHRKGWDGLLSSDINFDYLSVSLDQDVIFGVLGNSKYNVELGKFVNNKDLREIDIKRFRQSDPILYSDPLHSFQILDQSLNTSDLFFEFHHIHHFNGALVNNLPLIKKSRIRVVAGAGFLWVKENNFRYQELFGGIERIFKLGARRRLRLGIYGVVAESNRNTPTSNFKISFDVIDTWKKDWSF